MNNKCNIYSTVHTYQVTSSGTGAPFTWYLHLTISPSSLTSSSTLSNIALSWEADRQNLILEPVILVAGKPTPTAAMPRSANSLTTTPGGAGMGGDI